MFGMKTVIIVIGFKHVVSNDLPEYHPFDMWTSSLLWATPVSKSSYKTERLLEMLAPSRVELPAIANIEG